MQLVGVNTQKYHIGRMSLFRAPAWDGATNLITALTHVGNTEGEVNIQTNPEFSDLTLPETSGPAILTRYLAGENPSFDLGIFPSLTGLALFTPTARGSAGQQHRRLVREHTLWVVPEQLFAKTDVDGNVTFDAVIAYTTAGGFTKDAIALTTEEQRLADLSLFIWRAHFSRATPIYRHEDGGKAMQTVTVTVMQDFTKPDGCQLYMLAGEIDDFPTVDLDGA